MSFYERETIYVGNSYDSSIANGYINRYISANGYLELANTKGEFAAGQIIYGVSSGFSLLLSEFITKKIDAPDGWDTENYVVQDDGSVVAQDAHFTGSAVQEYIRDNIIIAP
tara:strand:+ start:62 stop:397 length:336 start_codon:yes stop_codon:yes gene_type:complete